LGVVYANREAGIGFGVSFTQVEMLGGPRLREWRNGVALGVVDTNREAGVGVWVLFTRIERPALGFGPR